MNIAIIDDEADIRYSIQRVLSLEHYQCYEFSGEEFDISKDFKEFNIEFLIIDMMLKPPITGLNIIKMLNDNGIKLPTIIITAYASPLNIIEIAKSGIVSILEKPFDAIKLIDMVRSYELKKKRKTYKITIKNSNESFIGSFETMGNVYQKIGIAANCDLSVLIHGETGTGKELIAKLIHTNSKRSHCPFISINCAAIPADLFESLVFGHEKGSFTGADAQQLGYIEQAGDGTLFLDEIGELDSLLQSKLLRFLEDKSYRRLGSRKNQLFTGRIICATNVNLQETIETKQFREDLFYRIAQIVIDLPSLAQRILDIEELCYHLIKNANKELKTYVEQIDKEALDFLKVHNYRGNIRELRNIIFNTVANTKTNTITLENIKQTIPNKEKYTNSIKLDQIFNKIIEEEGIENAYLITNKIESTILKEMLHVCPNITKLAQYLKIARNTLKAKIRYYKLDH